MFTPVKTRLQAFLDRTFKDSPEHIQTLREFGGEVRSYVQMSDRQLMTKRLLDEAATGMGAQCGAITMTKNGNGHLETLHTYGEWRGEAWVAAPLEYDGKRFGLLLLGPREGLQAVHTRGVRSPAGRGERGRTRAGGGQTSGLANQLSDRFSEN